MLIPLVGVTSAEDILLPTLRTRGWPNVKQGPPSIIKRLHYHTDAAALVVAVDSDDSKPHGPTCSQLPGNCRFCQLRDLVDRDDKQRLTPIQNRQQLKIAIGLCMPAIEAWYLCGHDPAVTEAAWISGAANNQPPYTRLELKKRAYGTGVPTLEIETQRAIEHAERLAADLDVLHTLFPAGCGVMLRVIETWQ